MGRIVEPQGIAEIGYQRTTDIFTDCTKELANQVCCTEGAIVDQWRLDICFSPASGDRGVSGLLQYYRNDTVTARR